MAGKWAFKMLAQVLIGIVLQMHEFVKKFYMDDDCVNGDERRKRRWDCKLKDCSCVHPNIGTQVNVSFFIHIKNAIFIHIKNANRA